MKRKTVIELPPPNEGLPGGLFSIEVGDTRMVFEGDGKEKLPAEVRTLDRPSKKQVRRTKRKATSRT